LLFELDGRGEADAPESLARDRKFNRNSVRLAFLRFQDPHDSRPTGSMRGRMRKFNYLLERRIGFIHFKHSAVSAHHFRFRVFAVTRAIRGFPRHVHWYGQANPLTSSPLRFRAIGPRQCSLGQVVHSLPYSAPTRAMLHSTKFRFQLDKSTMDQD